MHEIDAKLEITERVTMTLPETKGQNSIAYIIKEELRVEEDDEDWIFYQQVAKYDDTIGKGKIPFLEVSDSLNENSSDVRVVNHVNYDHTYTLWAEDSSSSQWSVASDSKHNRASGSSFKKSASDASSIPGLPGTGIKDDSYSDETKDISWDEKLACCSMNIPISIDDIINLPAVEFTERIIQCHLRESQLALVRDIRRRGKNKVAAQNCRKRKLDKILTLTEEVKRTRERKTRLIKERNFLMTEKARIKDRLTKLYRHVLQKLRDQEGHQAHTLLTSTAFEGIE